MANPGEVTLITLGSLSNLAVALIKEPMIAQNLKEVISMGGVIVPIVDKMGISRSPIEEYNFNCDKIATEIVFKSGVNLTIIPIDVTLKVPVPPTYVQMLKDCDRPIAKAAYRMLEVWPEQEKILYISGGVPTEHTDLWMHDPLCVATGTLWICLTSTLISSTAPRSFPESLLFGTTFSARYPRNCRPTAVLHSAFAVKNLPSLSLADFVRIEHPSGQNSLAKRVVGVTARATKPANKKSISEKDFCLRNDTNMWLCRFRQRETSSRS